MEAKAALSDALSALSVPRPNSWVPASLTAPVALHTASSRSPVPRSSLPPAPWSAQSSLAFLYSPGEKE